MLSQDPRCQQVLYAARTCIIEIGRELIAAKAEAAHGEWLPWLDREFGWSERTARNFMQVADAFKSASVADFTGLSIDATALYALSAPDGEQITKAGTACIIARHHDGDGPAKRAQARRVRTTRPRPARPIASSGSDPGSGTAPISSVKLSASGPLPHVHS
jgi:Protein of unknown function (DUF3102)